MNDLISFLVSEEAILVYLIALVVSIIYVGISFIKNTKQERIKKQNTMELNKLVEEVESQPKVQVKTPLFIIQEEQNEICQSLVSEVEKKEENIKLPLVKEKARDDLSVNHLLEKNNCNTVSSIALENDLVDKDVLEAKSINISTDIDKTKVENVALSMQQETLQEKKEEVIPEKIEAVQEISYTSIEPAKEEAKQQLAEVTERLEKEENIELTEFERMQEDTAIISLDELMKKAGELYGKNEEIQYQDEGNEPISLADLEKRKQEVLCLNKEDKHDKEEIIEQLELEDSVCSKVSSIEGFTPSTEKRFKSSPVISPVYGLENRPKEIYKNTELELENTANFEKLDAEIRKTNQFIVALKELQKKLD